MAGGGRDSVAQPPGEGPRNGNARDGDQYRNAQSYAAMFDELRGLMTLLSFGVIGICEI